MKNRTINSRSNVRLARMTWGDLPKATSLSQDFKFLFNYNSYIRLFRGRCLCLPHRRAD